MTALPVFSPTEAQVDARGVLGLLDAWEADPEIAMHSLMLLRHGRVFAQGWWAPYSADRVHLLYSVSKSFTSTALGLAVGEGLVGLDDLVLDHLADLAPRDVDEHTAAMRLRHLVSMSTGHLDDTWSRALGADPQDPVRAFLRLPPERPPGSVFAYNQSATYTLATVLQRVAGTSLTDYLRPRLLDPLGIGEAVWQQHPPGRDLGFSGLHATTDAVARLGQLYLQRGTWAGETLLSEAWVAEATRGHVSTAMRENPDWAQGYAFGFWGSRHGYRGDGAFGQFCVVIPELDLVVATTAGTEAMQPVLDAVWRHLLPAVGSPSSQSADDELDRRLAGLRMPTDEGSTTDPSDSAPSQSFEPAGGECAAQPSLVRVEVEPVAGAWRLTFVERVPGSGELQLSVRAAGAGWTVSPETDVPTAVSGGRTGSGEQRFRVLFLETPHELVLVCRPADGTFEASWSTTPLGGDLLHRLRAPQVSSTGLS